MSPKERIGIIVDNIKVNKQVYDLIKLSQDSKFYEISHIIIQDTSGKYPGNYFNKILKYFRNKGLRKLIGNILFLFLFKIESFITKKKFKQFKDFFNMYDLSEFKLKIIYVKPIFSPSGLVYTYTKNDLDILKAINLNLLIRAGSGILRGDILNIYKNGVISFHHGDNDVYRGGPPGFWEVFNKEKRSGFIIQKLTEELDGGDVIFKGFVPTSFYYTLNLATLYEKSNPFLHKTIEKLISRPLEIKVYTKKPYHHQIYKTPGIYKQITYIFYLFNYLLKKMFEKITRKNYRWGVAYQFAEDWRDKSILAKSKKILNPRNHFLADPFIWEKNGLHYCFLEDYDYSKKKGCISVYKITKNDCIKIGTALEEKFHLSYPFLFSYEDELYMCPETHETKDIRIYKCVEFPLKWEFEKILISNVSAAETNIFKKNDRWWLLTNIDTGFIKEHSSELHIFSNNDPLSSKWSPNKLNPVLFDPLIARNGGLIIDDGDVYRVYQRQGFHSYGEALGLTKITILKDDKFEEKKIFEIEPNFFKKIKGTHTYNFKNGLLVIDFYEQNHYK